MRPLDVRLKDYSRYTEVRQLAYAVARAQQLRGFRSLAVLSVRPAEGRTLLCALLAMAYAEVSRSRALVVDTARRGGAGSVPARDCFPAREAAVDVLTLTGRRPPPPFPAPPGEGAEGQGALARLNAVLSEEEDVHWTVRKVMAEGASRYGLVLLDTVPLDSRNKDNVDPRLVARLAGASVLVVSRRLLESPRLEESLGTLQDPTLRLIGLIANEGFRP